jgi:hypothetical protein
MPVRGSDGFDGSVLKTDALGGYAIMIVQDEQRPLARSSSRDRVVSTGTKVERERGAGGRGGSGERGGRGGRGDRVALCLPVQTEKEGQRERARERESRCRSITRAYPHVTECV